MTRLNHDLSVKAITLFKDEVKSPSNEKFLRLDESKNYLHKQTSMTVAGSNSEKTNYPGCTENPKIRDGPLNRE